MAAGRALEDRTAEVQLAVELTAFCRYVGGSGAKGPQA